MLATATALVLAALSAPAAPPRVATADGPASVAVAPSPRSRAGERDTARAVGHAPPAFADSMTWIGTEPLDFTALRGRVVLLQTWQHGSNSGRSSLRRAGRAAALSNTGDDLVVIAVHTPEKADDAAKFLERQAPKIPVAIDHDGAFSDALGIWRRPTNFLVDRQGVIRYAGLSTRRTLEAITTLVEEPFDPDAPAPAPLPEPQAGPATGFPEIAGTVNHARDIRGQAAPPLVVDQWLSPRPVTEDRVVLVDFWATWCGPCVASIPHVNSLADRFRDSVTVIGVSDERPDAFQRGLERRRLRPDQFRYSIALDPQGRMERAIAIRGIPHAIVVGTDGIVRWQGHPASLRPAIIEQIVAADRTRRGESAGPRRRWAQWLAEQPR